MNKNSKFDDALIELLLGSVIVAVNDFNSGILLEKIIVLLGLVIIMVGIIRATMEYKSQNKKGMMIFLSVLGLCVAIAFFGLLYRFIIALI